MLFKTQLGIRVEDGPDFRAGNSFCFSRIFNANSFVRLRASLSVHFVLQEITVLDRMYFRIVLSFSIPGQRVLEEKQMKFYRR